MDKQSGEHNIKVGVCARQKSSMFSVEDQSSSQQEDAHSVMCSNYNCPSVMAATPLTHEIYCSFDCFKDFTSINMGQQTFNIGERNMMYIGRGGTGLLEEMDDIIVFCDEKTGERSSKWYPKHAGLKERCSHEKCTSLLEKIKLSPKKKSSFNRENSKDNVEMQQKSKCKDPVTVTSLPLIAKPQKLTLSQKHLVVVVFVVNPWEIYVQTEKSAKQAQEIQKICNIGMNAAWKSANWVPITGNFCVAPYKEEMYRAKILNVSDEFVEILYVDYGNTTTMGIDQVSEIGLQLLHIVPQCFRLKMCNVKPTEGRNYWNEAAITNTKRLEHTFVYVEPLSLDLNGSGEHLSRIYEAENNKFLKDFGEKLIKDGFASCDDIANDVTRKKILIDSDTCPSIEKRAFIPENKISKVKLGFINNPSSFYVIVDVDEHKKMKERMVKHVMLKKVFYKPEINEVCGAKIYYQWKRARKIDGDDRTTKVLSLDDGEDAVVTPLNIIKLKKDLLDVLPLAVHCSLYNADPNEGIWSEEAINKLKSIAQSESEIFVESCYLDAEKTYVRLLISAKLEDFGESLINAGLASIKMIPKNMAPIKEILHEPLIENTELNKTESKVVCATGKEIDPAPKHTEDRKSTLTEGRAKFFIDEISTVGIKDNSSVLVVRFYSFNRCFIQTHDGAENLLDLQDEINLHIASATSLEDLPTVGEIVLGTLRDGIRYNRGVVEAVVSDNQVKIRFIDLGCEEVLHFKDLRYPSSKIVEGAIAGHIVLLDGLPEDPMKILKSDFDMYCSRLTKNLRIQLTKGGADTGVPECKLYHLKGGRCVNDEIFNLGIWKWEIAHKIGRRSDNEIKNYEGYVRSFYHELLPIDVPLGEVDMKVAILIDCRTIMCVPIVPSIQRDLRVVETQMNLYLDTVAQSDFYPVMNQLHFAKKVDGKWMRCTRFENTGSLAIDYGTAFRISDKFLRAMPEDFCRIPHFAVACTLEGIPTPCDSTAEKIIRGILKPRRTLKFMLTAFSKDSKMYIAKCDEVTKALEKGDCVKTMESSTNPVSNSM